MKKVTGIGGIFFKAKDPKAINEWYKTHLGFDTSPYGTSFEWREIDVESDGELRRRFTDEVPVVFIDGRKAFKYRMDEQEFLRRLAS